MRRKNITTNAQDLNLIRPNQNVSSNANQMRTLRCVLAAALCYGNPAIVSLKRTTKGPKVIERLRKKLSEQESLLLLMSPNMAFRVANRNGKVSHRMSEAFSKTQADDLLFPFNDFLMDSIFGLILFPD